MTFEEMVRKIRAAVGSRSRIVHVPVSVARLAAGAIGMAVRDVLITDHELGGLMSELAPDEEAQITALTFSRLVMNVIGLQREVHQVG